MHLSTIVCLQRRELRYDGFRRSGGTATISRGVVQTLLDLLTAKDYEVVGPTVRDDAIVYDRIARLADLPAGWTDRQEAGRYRLERRDDGALFGFAVGPQAWKRFLHRPVETLWTMRKTEDGVTVESGDSAVPKFAFIGVRACELHAIAIQDRVFAQGPYAGCGLRDAAPRRFHRCRQLRPGRRNLLLRFDANRAEGRLPGSTSRSPNCSTATTMNFWSRSAAKRALEFSESFRTASPPTANVRRPRRSSRERKSRWAAAWRPRD